MKSRIHLKLLMAPLSMLAVFACSPDQYQQASEYDDVYFTSADRKTAPKVVAKPEAVQATETANVITLSNQSKQTVDPTILSRYNNSESKEVEYFVESEVEPRVKKANQLNYDDFVWDYENEQLASYALPVDWAEEWDKRYFNDLVYNDFEFRLAWYDQYYLGNSTRMDRYITASNDRIGRTSISTFGRNNFGNRFWNPGFNVSIGFGNSFGFYDPFFPGVGFGYDPFFDPFYDPFLFRTSVWGFGGVNRWNRRWRNRWGFGGGFGFGNPYYCPPIFSNRYIYRGEVFVARNNRTYTRGGRLSSTSVASVRSDAVNGVAATRSQRLASASGTSRVSRSSIENRSSRSGRVRSSSSVGRSSTSRSSSGLSRDVVSTRSNRVRTDVSRTSSSRSSSRVATSTSRGRSSAITSRTSRSSRSSSTFSGGRASSRSAGRTSGVSFNRNSSSRSSSGVSRSSSQSRSSSSRGVSRSSSRSSSSRGVSRSSSSRSSSSRSSGSVSRSSSSRSSGSSRSSSSRSSSSRSSSSRSGRGGK